MPQGKKPARPAKPHPARAGCDVGDEVYARHRKHGALALRITGAGEDGFTARCAKGKRHRLPWDSYLGHRQRVAHRYDVVEHGADGALVRDRKGRTRFLAGLEAPPEPAPTPAPPNDDPILGGLDRLKPLRKAEPMMPDFPARLLLLKAAMPGREVKGRPGLALQRVTDRVGHQTQRWKRTGPKEKGEERQAAPDEAAGSKPPGGGGDKPAAYQHGQVVAFRHGDVEGRGKIVASGRDGVTLQGEDGREHKVRHEDLGRREPSKPSYPARTEGEDDTAYGKRLAEASPDPDHLPEDHGRYFNDHPDAKHVPIDQLHPTKDEEHNERSGRNGARIMAAAYHGAVGKRDPVSVRKREGGGFEVTDGNGTLTAAKKHGWKTLPVVEAPAEDAKAAGGDGDLGPAPPSLFDEGDVQGLEREAAQPVKDAEELFGLSAPALEHLKEWLNKGKGICAQLGHQTMTKAPEGVTDEEWGKPGGMLFIAPLKGRARSEEKVANDYGGDWSRLLDTVRCSIAVDSHDELKGVLEKLKAGGLKLAKQPKDRFAKPIPCGYRDALLNVKLPNGLVAEVQLHVKAMLRAKNAGHKHYEIERSLEPKVKDGTATPEEMAAFQKAQDDMKALYVGAWKKAAGEMMAKALGRMRMVKKGGRAAKAAVGAGRDSGGDLYTYLEHDNAYFRRRENGQTRSVDDVLIGGQWKPYKGRDPLAPGVYGAPVDDPLGGGGDRKPLRKAAPLLVVFAKAQIRGGALGDLFEQKVTVHTHTTKTGAVVPEHQATRKKRAADAPKRERRAMTLGEASNIAEAVFVHHNKHRKGASVSYAAMLDGWAADAGRKIHPDDEGHVLKQMAAIAQSRAKAIVEKAKATPKPVQSDGLAPHTPQVKDAPAPRERPSANGVKAAALEAFNARHSGQTKDLDTRNSFAIGFFGAAGLDTMGLTARNKAELEAGKAAGAKWMRDNGHPEPVRIPDGVRSQVERHARNLRAHHEDLTAARKEDGMLADPRHEREYRAKHGPAIEAAKAKIAEFRRLAEAKGIHPSHVDHATGGPLPDLDETGPIKPVIPTRKGRAEEDAAAEANGFAQVSRDAAARHAALPAAERQAKEARAAEMDAAERARKG